MAPVPVDLSKISDVVKNGAIKKTVYDKLVTKVYNIDTSEFVLKTTDNTDKAELEKKIPDVSNLVKKKKNSLNQKTELLILVIQQQKLH